MLPIYLCRVEYTDVSIDVYDDKQEKFLDTIKEICYPPVQPFAPVYFPTSIMSTARAEATRRRVSAVSASARAAWASPPSLCSVDLIGQAILMNGFNGLK